MNRFLAASAALVLLLGAWVRVGAQSKLAFEVVSIRPAPRPTPETIRDGTARLAFNVNGTRVEIVGYGLGPILSRAFRVEPQQVDVGSFRGAETFEIQAKLPAGATGEQVPEMLQSMLAERFKLAYHRETREYDATVVSVGKGGMKLPRLPDGTREESTSARLADGTTRFIQTGTVGSLFPVMNSFGGFRQMVDETGLDGNYRWVRDALPPDPGADFGVAYRAAQQESFKVMLDAAGLKLEARKIQRETIVVDHLEREPTEN